MFQIKSFVFASILIVASLCTGVISDFVPVPAGAVPLAAPVAPYAIAPFARSFSAHSIQHSIAVPIGASPLVAPPAAAYPLPLPYAAPYYAAL